MSDLHEADEQYTDIIQIPAVFVGGKALTPLSQYSKLDTPTLRDIADVMRGELRYLKLRATYSLLDDSNLCGHRDCFRPVGSNVDGRCSDHVRKSH